MSSDYIPRLRSELLRAGATKPSRWAPARRTLRPLAVAVAVALIALAVVLAFPRDDERPNRTTAGTLHLSYRGEPSSARIMAERLNAAGVRGAGVSASGGGVAITVPASARADVRALVASGRIGIYDWERSVLGPRGEPAPRDAGVTGGQGAGQSGATTKATAEARARRAAGGRAVRAEPHGNGWFALGGPPVLTNADIKRARADVDPTTQEPIVVLELTAGGQKAFGALTRELAHRGGGRGLDAAQHLAIVIDDRIASVPYIDGRQAPNGIDGRNGVEIAGGLTPQTARRLAALLSAGPLAAPLSPAG